MNLQNYQYLLAKIYTDAEFRKQFFAQPVQIGADFGISPELATQLAQEHQKAIDFFSNTLINKRLTALKSFLPHTCQILNTHLYLIFEEFASQNILLTEDRYAEDAFAFSKFLQESTFFVSQLTDYQREIIIFEKLSIRRERTFFYSRILQFHPFESENQAKSWHLFLHFHIGKKYFYWFW